MEVFRGGEHGASCTDVRAVWRVVEGNRGVAVDREDTAVGWDCGGCIDGMEGRRRDMEILVFWSNLGYLSNFEREGGEETAAVKSWETRMAGILLFLLLLTQWRDKVEGEFRFKLLTRGTGVSPVVCSSGVPLVLPETHRRPR